MRRYDAGVRRALRARGLRGDAAALLAFIAANGWTAEPGAWRPPEATTPWPVVRIRDQAGAVLGIGVDPGGALDHALAAAVVDALEPLG